MSFLHLKTVYYLYLYLSLTSQFYCLTITFSFLCLCKQLIIYVSFTSRPGQTKKLRKWVMECWSHAPCGGPHQTLFGKTFIQQSVGRDKNNFWIPLWILNVIFQIKKLNNVKRGLVLCRTTQWTTSSRSTYVTNMAATLAQKSIDI